MKGRYSLGVVVHTYCVILCVFLYPEEINIQSSLVSNTRLGGGGVVRGLVVNPSYHHTDGGRLRGSNSFLGYIFIHTVVQYVFSYILKKKNIAITLSLLSDTTRRGGKGSSSEHFSSSRREEGN